MVNAMIILAKLELTLLIIVKAHVHIVFRLTVAYCGLLWLTVAYCGLLWLKLIACFLSKHSMSRVLVRTVHCWFSLILLLLLEVNTSFYL